MTKNEVDIKDSLQEGYVVPESIFDKKRTKTSHFMLNTILPNGTGVATEYFVNAFLNDDQFKHYFTRPLFLLFKADKTDARWRMINTKLRSKPEYILEYFCGMEGKKDLVMMVFKVPDKYAKDYIHFKAGKYSEFSEEYKRVFPRYMKKTGEDPEESVIWRVLYKSKKLREELTRFFGDDTVFTETDELWGKPLPEYEHYRYTTQGDAP